MLVGIHEEDIFNLRIAEKRLREISEPWVDLEVFSIQAIIQRYETQTQRNTPAAQNRISRRQNNMPTLYGECPKCHTSYVLEGIAPPAGVLCPNCGGRGNKRENTLVGVIHFEPRAPTLREATEALLKYIEENSVFDSACDDGDDHSSLYRSDEFEIVIDELKRALKQCI